MRVSLTGLRTASGIAGGLAHLIYRPSTPARAMALIRHRQAHRREMFLTMLHASIWSRPASPYRRLMDWAGWSLDRVRDAVDRYGVEGALASLREAGVYLRYEEFKGRTPIQRGSLTIACEEDDFNNPSVIAPFEERTGGTRSGGSRVPASFDFVATNRAPARMLLLEALGVGGVPLVLWMQVSTGLHWWLSLAHMRRAPARWLATSGITGFVVPATVKRIVRLGSLMSASRGVRQPQIEQMPLASAPQVLDILDTIRRGHGACVLVTTPSIATRLAGLARGDGGLEGITFVTQSEPLTPGKHAEIVRTGARVAGRYGFTEAGSVAEGCARPEAVDDSHFQSDCYGLVRDARTLPDGRSVDALLITSLLPSSPRILLNVESDDFADVTERRCGCLWDTLGLHTHIANIRSFSKLTGEGTTLLGTDCVRILEEVLPREFGGQAIHYQLLETEDVNHLTRLLLVVSPAVGRVDDRRMLQRFLEELRNPAHARSAVPPLWQQADTIRVVRQEPVATAGGKLLPFHTQALAPHPAAAEPGSP